MTDNINLPPGWKLGGGSMTDFNLGEFLKCVREERMTYGEFRWHHIRVLADEIERLMKRVEELEAKLASYDRADRDLNEALNMGDGSYRP